MGDHAAWGVRAREAFDGAVFRLLLSGTPFRSDSAPIPWVSYDEDGVSQADYVYGYAQALVDGVCRPITFLPYDGEMEWKSDGRLRSADLRRLSPGRGVGPPAAHGARPRGRLDGGGASRRGYAADARCDATTPRRAGSCSPPIRITPGRSPRDCARIAGEAPELVMRPRAARRSEPAPETAFAARERLRAERARLVSLVSRRTGEQHRVIHGRVNRATGAGSVGDATREELERGNELLRRDLRR